MLLRIPCRELAKMIMRKHPNWGRSTEAIPL
jgi:hypothetical protein